MIKAIITFIFGNTFWDYLVEFFGSPKAIIEAVLIPLVISTLIKYFIGKHSSNNITAEQAIRDSEAFIKNGNYNRAIAICNQALEENQNNADLYNNRGWAYH